MLPKETFLTERVLGDLHSKGDLKENSQLINQCIRCKKSLKIRVLKKDPKFCSVYCKSIYVPESNDPNFQKCTNCKKFKPKQPMAFSHAGYCSSRCQNKHFLKRVGRQRSKKRRESRKRNNPHFYDSRVWQELRYATLRKYGFKCMCCGAGRNKQLHVDHIKPRSKYPLLELDPENLQVLCKDCNLGKSNKYEDDFRDNSL